MANDKKSKKIAIISINKYSIHMNYGAALHSYAFQQVLDDMGYDNEIVDYKPTFMHKYNLKFPILNALRRGKIDAIVKWLLFMFDNLRKYNKFQHFFKSECRFTEKVYDNSNVNELAALGFGAYICESDVIWKITSTKGFEKGFFLDFEAAKKSKRIAYAPTLGRDAHKYADDYRRLLKDFDYISTREKNGAQFLSQLLGREVDFVLDPTLLLSSDDYLKVAVRPKEQGYVLLYNCMCNDSNMIKNARRVAAKKGLQIIEVSAYHGNRIRYNHKVKDSIGIEEFLGYFAHAEYVICNAFHGACFSIIFQKEFCLFQRDESDYRMDNLVEALGVGDVFIRREDSDCEVELFTDKIDYIAVNKRLNILKERSYNYITKSLE